MAKCGSCQAEIIWAKHVTTGKLSCLDAEPSAAGRWHVTEQLDLAGDTHTVYEHGDGGGHTSHFATCPNAEHHRKPVESASE